MSILTNYEAILNECNVIYTDGTITAFINEHHKPHRYYSGYIAVTNNSTLFDEDVNSLSILSDKYKITYTEFTDDESHYIIGFDDLPNKLGLNGVKDKLKSLVDDVKLFTKDTNVSIASWFNTAKPKPTNQNVVQQMAYHFEEVAEMCKAINCHDMETALKKFKADLLAIASIPHKADEFVDKLNNVELLDALADQQVTAIGVGILLGYNMKGALDEVNRSNWTKFVNGKAIIDEHGKIMKGNHQKPDLEPYIQTRTLTS